MSLLTTINSIRRSLMRGITRRLGQTHLTVPDAIVPIQRVLVSRPNHRLGNLLLITPLLAEIERTLPEAKVDLFVKGGIAGELFKNYKSVNRIIQLPKKPAKRLIPYLRGWLSIRFSRYDLVINVVHSSSSGRISTRMANARWKFLGETDDTIRAEHADHMHIAKHPVYSFRHFLKQLGYTVSRAPVASLNLRLTENEIEEGKRLLVDLVKNDRRTIAIYTYATGAKCYDKTWWQVVYEGLLARFPDFNIIEVLPVENISQINFKAPSFYSKDLRAIAGLISNVDVFIAADSGMMHLAAATKTPVLGLFKAKNLQTYAPFNPGSQGVDTNETKIDELIEMIAVRVKERASASGVAS